MVFCSSTQTGLRQLIVKHCKVYLTSLSRHFLFQYAILSCTSKQNYLHMLKSLSGSTYTTHFSLPGSCTHTHTHTPTTTNNYYTSFMGNL